MQRLRRQFSVFIKWYLPLPVLLCIVVSCFAQKNTGAKQVTDTATINRLLYAAGKELDPDTAIKLYDHILRLSTAANYANGVFLAHMIKGIKYLEKEDYEQVRNCTKAALPWAPGAIRKAATVWCYGNIGEAYFYEGDYIRASEYYHIALQEFRKLPYEQLSAVVNIYNDLGKLNIRLDQQDKALFYFNLAEDMARKGNFDYQLAESFENKGNYYNGMHQPDSAKKYFNAVMDIGKKIGKVDLQARANDELGKAFTEAGEYENAISYLQKAIAMAKNRFNDVVMDASYSLGDAFLRLHRFKEAEAILDSALKETKAHNIKDNYINCYTKLTAVYKATGQYKKAADCMDSIMVLKDSLTSAEKAKAINHLEIRYKTAEKDKEIVQNQLLIAQQNSKLTRKNIWIGSIAGGIFLLLIGVGSLYRNSRHKQRLQAEQIRSLQHENTIGILKGVVQGEESERSRIARELHDGIGGMLSAAMMRFMTIRHSNEAITQMPAYNEAMAMLNGIGEEIRKTAHNLMPEVLLQQTLPDALRSFCSSMQQEDRQIDFQSFGSFDELPQDMKLTIYRIVQELLKNIVQHAEATHVLVQLLMHEQVLTITVEDNGKGFDAGAVKTGMGLHNLQARVNSLAGHFTLDSAAGRGTSVYIELDIRNTGT
jgi:signal transduction histidine kinase